MEMGLIVLVVVIILEIVVITLVPLDGSVSQFGSPSTPDNKLISQLKD